MSHCDTGTYARRPAPCQRIVSFVSAGDRKRAPETERLRGYRKSVSGHETARRGHLYVSGSRSNRISALRHGERSDAIQPRRHARLGPAGLNVCASPEASAPAPSWLALLRSQRREFKSDDGLISIFTLHKKWAITERNIGVIASRCIVYIF